MTSHSTLCAQALHFSDPTNGAVVPPVSLSTTFARGADYELAAGRMYARDDNPTFEHAERLLAALEGGAAARLFPSGLAAAHTVLTSWLQPGDGVVATRVMYFGMRKLLRAFCAQFQVRLELVDGASTAQLTDAIRAHAPRLAWIETPGNPTLDVVDIAAAAAAAHEVGAKLVVDSTAATPILTKPISFGADLVMHSATKYLNGHTDVLAGALVTARDDEDWHSIRTHRHDAGIVPGPLDAWLLLRGMRTLAVRMERHCENAMFLAEKLRAHPRVSHVMYPGLSSHTNHDVARRQMRGGFGGLLSIRVDRPLDVVKDLQLFLRATSLGGTESLVEHRASVEGPDSPTPADLLRLSIGIEDKDELWADLQSALK